MEGHEEDCPGEGRAARLGARQEEVIADGHKLVHAKGGRSLL